MKRGSVQLHNNKNIVNKFFQSYRTMLSAVDADEKKKTEVINDYLLYSFGYKEIPTCHKAFHYGTKEVQEKMIEALYQKCAPKYHAIGLDISIEEIKKLYKL